MAESYPKVYQGQLSTTETTLYTVPGGWKFLIKEVIVCNTTATNASVSMSVVTAGGTASAVNRITSVKTVPLNDLIILALATGMGQGDFISALASANTSLTISISGILYQ